MRNSMSLHTHVLLSGILYVIVNKLMMLIMVLTNSEQHKFLHAHWLIFIVNKWTDTWIYDLYHVATSESRRYDSLLS